MEKKINVNVKTKEASQLLDEIKVIIFYYLGNRKKNWLYYQWKYLEINSQKNW